jgi:CRP/FNR family transcriptional regulator
MDAKLATELAGLGFLDEATLLQQTSLLSSVTRHEYHAGDALYHSGDESCSLFVITGGLVKLLTYMPNGRSRIVRLHRRGSMIGMDGLMGRDHDHTAIAIDEVHAYQIPHMGLQEWREQQPHLFNQLLEKWYEYLNYADTWITDFSTGSVKGRVARLVRFLARFDTQTGPQVVELLTTEEMAEILGVTPESVSRVVAEFKREGLLEAIENNTESLFTFDPDILQQAIQD